jgi:hypothetical protein
MRRLQTILGAMALMIPVGAVHAEVELVDDAVFGVDSVIRDVSNQMEFLGLDHTAGYPYTDILLEFGPGGDFEGWRVASEADMELLGDSAGIVHGSSDPGIVAKAEQLRDWFGNVRLSTTHERARGLISDTVTGGYQAAFSIGRRFNVDPNEANFRISGYGPIYPDESTFLVRDILALAEIDIKPGSDPNSINPFSRGVIPVAILTTEDFDALMVDADSVLFGPAEAEKRHKRAHVEDVDGDGDLDLLLHFRTQDTGIALGDTEACVIGETYDGVPLMGCDSVRTVPPE